MSTLPTQTRICYVPTGTLQVAKPLYQFVAHELLPGSGVDAAQFWMGLEMLVADFAPKNSELLQQRVCLQQQIDEWHQQRTGEPHDAVAYREFLDRIGYLLPEPADFLISTQQVDDEIARLAGPQLVVPVMNARYALNAANARWGSLYDALYGTDVISDDENRLRKAGYDRRRGQQVIEFGRRFLDEFFPLANHASHNKTKAYRVTDGQLQVTLERGDVTTLSDPDQLAGYTGNPGCPDSILLRHRGLHVEVCIDANDVIGQQDKAGVRDIVMEAALTTIQDCEDSVAAVDADDKIVVYRNWLGLMKGDLTDTFTKNGRVLTRRLAADREFITPDGKPLCLPGRSLMLVRNVGHLMSINAVLDGQGREVPEGILDALMTSAAALHDLRKQPVLPGQQCRNSRTGSVYIVKPKMHGPAEVAFSCELFAAVERILGLQANTLKIGIMDEERRTSVNLKACIYEARERLIFINTGFLDRTGDEIHTSMEAGAFVRKADIKSSRWINAYENRNVAIGLTCGLSGRAQIGKGMWAMPDNMGAMMNEKIAQLYAGASCAWVPSPTAATLHAMHYHRVDVAGVQRRLAQKDMLPLDDLLSLSLAEVDSWSKEQIQQELDNNAQGLLGYVVRWIDQGIGCSKVPDIAGTGLMEDRATLRISSQHMGNWLRHGVCTVEQVTQTLRRMAVIVDAQNASDPHYRAMSADFENSVAFRAACDLVFKAGQQPCGYTEPLLHRHRIRLKEGVCA